MAQAKFLATFLLAFLVPLFPAESQSRKTTFVLCENAAGIIKVKTRCNKKETRISRNNIGAGAQGIQGPKGDKGDAGPQGPRGLSGSCWGRIPSGTTIIGGISEYDWSGANSFNVSFSPATSPWLDDEHVVLKLNEVVLDECPNISECLDSAVLINSLEKSDLCDQVNGLAAPRGLVCIYPTDFRHIKSFTLSGNGNVGFKGWWNSTVNGDSSFAAGWAYTAP